MHGGTQKATLEKHTIDPYRPYRSRLLSPAKLKELSALRPARMVFDTFLCWFSILGAWSLVALHPTWWTVLLAIPIIGSRYYGLFIIGHDGIHGRLFEDKRLNNLFNDVFIFGAIGALTRINNKNHLLHHLHLAHQEDPDRHKHGCFNKTEHSELFVFLLGLSSVVPSVKNVFISNARLAKSPQPDTKGDKPAYTAGDLALLLCWQIVLLGGLTWFIGWWAYPVLWLFPVYAFAFLGDNVRSFAEHSHPEADEKADHHRLITYTSNPIERMFFAPMNMNFHTVHHLWVSIPYYNLPKADQEIRQSPEARSLEWRGGYLGYLLRYYRALPLEECKKKVAA
jgi:fatty acid desaturase